MRASNFDYGTMKNTFNSMYSSQFERRKPKEFLYVSQEKKDELAASHWNHSKAFDETFRTEQRRQFKTVEKSADVVANRKFGHQNTLN